MDNTTKILESVLSSTGGIWATKAQILPYLNKYRITEKDFEKNLGNAIVKYEDKYAFTASAKRETNVALNIMRLKYCREKTTYDRHSILQAIAQFEDIEHLKLHETQKDAVITVMQNPFCLLIGGPGTGKTTVCKCIIFAKKQLKKKCSIVLMAPTGKAAKRLSEVTKEKVCTIHKRMISNMSICENTVFVDESSMIDLELADRLFSQMQSGSDLVLIGDTDQLPSVGAGAILRDLIESSVIAVARLTVTFRQSGASALSDAIKNIKNNVSVLPESEELHKIVIDNNLPTEQVDKLSIAAGIESYKKAVKKYGKENVAFLIPYRQSGVCSDQLNPILQKELNTNRSYYKNGNLILKKDDLVIQLINRNECANGDVGKVIALDESGVTVNFQGNIVHYSPDEINQLSLAYAMTIHKSQGSEYACVVMLLLKQHATMLKKNLIYTAITRAKKELTIIYQSEALEAAINSSAYEGRTTLLSAKLKAVDEEYRAVYGIA